MAEDERKAGRFDEARAIVSRELLTLEDVDQIFAHKTLLASIERGAKNYREALRIHADIYPLAQLCNFHILRARFHNGLGITYEESADVRSDHLDRALIEYEAARFHAEEAGDLQYAGNLENNIAVVLCRLGRTAEARGHLDKARRYFVDDPVTSAQVDDTTAQVCLQDEQPLEALSYIVDAVKTFISRGEKKLLDDSIPTLIKAAVDYQAER
ncbi:MAG TPA: hypothetical protein VN256_12955 [Pyrinomonadaceae bacterium]|nr:hypothetical protein [Pyrinomonadaceae bacterium]